jgi:hypothetical protein
MLTPSSTWVVPTRKKGIAARIGTNSPCRQFDLRRGSRAAVANGPSRVRGGGMTGREPQTGAAGRRWSVIHPVIRLITPVRQVVRPCTRHKSAVRRLFRDEVAWRSGRPLRAHRESNAGHVRARRNGPPQEFRSFAAVPLPSSPRRHPSERVTNVCPPSRAMCRTLSLPSGSRSTSTDVALVTTCVR